MRYHQSFDELEFDPEVEGEGGYEELEYGDQDREFEYDHETGGGDRRIINVPQIVDRETYDELEFEDEFEEEISAADDRKPVRDTTVVPFRFICDLSIKMKSTDGKTRAIGHGSGTLIGNRHILTCGHNIRVKIPVGGVEKTFDAEAIEVTPGKNSSAKGDNKPFGSYAADKWKAHVTWVSRFDPQYDFALITLKKDVGSQTFKSIGNKRLGCWGSAYGGGTLFRDVDANSLRGATVNVGGYPGDMCGDKRDTGSCPASKKGGTQFCAWDKVIDPQPSAEPRLIYHKADSKPGQSGAPIWRWDQTDNKRLLVGVHTAGVTSVGGAFKHNTGVRITYDVRKQLATWGLSA